MSFTPTRIRFASTASPGDIGARLVGPSDNRNNNASLPQAGD